MAGEKRRLWSAKITKKEQNKEKKMVEEYEEARSCRSQKVGEIAAKALNDPHALLGQTADGMLGKAAVIAAGSAERIGAITESVDEEDDFGGGVSAESETAVFLKKFCSRDGNTYKICPEKWTIVDQGFGTDLTCCAGACEAKSFLDIKKEVAQQCKEAL